MEAVEIKQPDQENIADKIQVNAFDLAWRSQQRDLLNRAMACLCDRDRAMMSMYYEQDLTMKEIGERLGIDESRISQIHTTALARLRTRVRTLLHPSQPAGSRRPTLSPDWVLLQARSRFSSLRVVLPSRHRNGECTIRPSGALFWNRGGPASQSRKRHQNACGLWRPDRSNLAGSLSDQSDQGTLTQRGRRR